ncbi:Kazrin [Takifugu flavidus]|uniref:Kazrin n=1 Tax=Takifugu flavidus TaxID=433684 RepID=A0A5C6N5H3_9TELE|nr:Kazrin [Takifugu flavidus]
MMEDNKHLAHRIDGAIQSASQEVTNLRSELSATSRRLAELGASSPPGLENHHQYNHQDDSLHYRDLPSLAPRAVFTLGQRLKASCCHMRHIR